MSTDSIEGLTGKQLWNKLLQLDADDKLCDAEGNEIQMSTNSIKLPSGRQFLTANENGNVGNGLGEETDLILPIGAVDGFQKTLKAYKNFVEARSGDDFFRINTPNNFDCSIEVVVISYNGPVDSHRVQKVLAHYSNRNGDKLGYNEISQVGSGGGTTFISSVALSGAGIIFRVDTLNNGTGTSNETRAYIKVISDKADQVTLLVY